MNLHGKVLGQGYPVLLIHGLFGMGDNLAMVARSLAERYQVHSLDLRNHGRSPWADSMHFSDMAADVIDSMDARQIARAHVLGHSLGGKVAMQLALTAAERVARLVVADIAPVTYHSRGHDDVFAALRAVDPVALDSRRDAEVVLERYIDDPAVRQFILKNLYRNSTGRFAWRINIDVLYRCYDQMREGIFSDGAFIGETLFIKGEHSPYIQEKHRAAILRLFPRAQLKIIQGAGHWLHAEKPAAFNKIVGQFLAGKDESA